jgi:hypothetical protein
MTFCWLSAASFTPHPLAWSKSSIPHIPPFPASPHPETRASAPPPHQTAAAPVTVNIHGWGICVSPRNEILGLGGGSLKYHLPTIWPGCLCIAEVYPVSQLSRRLSICHYSIERSVCDSMTDDISPSCGDDGAKDLLKQTRTLGSVRHRHEHTNEIILIPQPSTDPNDPLNWWV